MPRPGGAPENMIPAKKGEIRNPKGYPKGLKHKKTEFTEIMNALYPGSNPYTGEAVKVDGITRLKFELIRVAMGSDNDAAKIAAIERLLDRIEGKVAQTLNANISNAKEQIKELFPTKDEIEEADQP